MVVTMHRIALIEDDTEFSSILLEMLTLNGFDVNHYFSAEEFIKRNLHHTNYRCIICDIRLKHMSGLQLQEKLVAAKNMTPLIFITGHCSMAIKNKVMKAGCHYLFLKPFNNLDLVQSIRQVIQRVS